MSQTEVHGYEIASYQFYMPVYSVSLYTGIGIIKLVLVHLTNETIRTMGDDNMPLRTSLTAPLVVAISLIQFIKSTSFTTRGDNQDSPIPSNIHAVKSSLQTRTEVFLVRDGAVVRVDVSLRNRYSQFLP